MKTVKKLAALALALAMALTALPAGAFAAGGEETPTEQPAFGGSAHVYVGMFESPEQNAGFDSTQVWSTSQGQSFMVGFEAADGALAQGRKGNKKQITPKWIICVPALRYVTGPAELGRGRARQNARHRKRLSNRAG